MKNTRKKQILIVSLIVLFFIGLFFTFSPFQLFIKKAFLVLSKADIKALKAYLLTFGPWAPVISGLLMVFQSVVAPLPAFVITFTNGLLFGAFWGTVLSWSSAMAGASVCYAIARVYGRPVVEKLVGKKSLDVTDRFFERYGKHSILIARLLPIISFDVVSYAAGLTSVSFWEFFIATGIGQLPATIIYSYLGQNLTGSVKIVFWIFILVITLVVVGAAWRSRYEKKLLRIGDKKPQYE